MEESDSLEMLAMADAPGDAPTVVVAVLATVAASLVGFATFASMEAGNTAVGLGFLTATALFLVAVGVFEAGRSLGSRHVR